MLNLTWTSYVADLRQMRSDNINRGNDQYTPRFAPPPSYSPELQLSGRGGAGGNATRAANSYRDDLIGPPPVQTTAEGETSHARGGHGIFGMPKVGHYYCFLIDYVHFLLYFIILPLFCMSMMDMDLFPWFFFF